eukprot:CAMPEP_0174310894 /NCGR_PEP_ID=MMETSP0810-20121108/3351_1 /TAXON_ID=73025 ORGANISM="Eutreptiella gymnastica-like, Strain CCMP1594" /NCGR_SAMPLE_ID=MMETSP0810 /ASSEMBLY_ACC=CAM_ASM_000659 /LENGTH=48 /DNA_ID= /DNA_START= /DNA_END= /DNA_ORIENTATION=
MTAWVRGTGLKAIHTCAGCAGHRARVLFAKSGFTPKMDVASGGGEMGG